MTVILLELCQVFDLPIAQLIHKLICYADDLLLRWKISAADQLQQAVVEIGHTLDVLEKHQLVFNAKKTVVLLRLEGSQAHKTTNQHLIRTKEGLRIKIPRNTGPDTRLPVVHSHTYLGCKLSYYDFEKLTLAHRLHIGRSAFSRLRPWLAKRHLITQKTRAQVWRACVLSSYLHGLSATGLTQEGLQKLVFRCHAELRLIGQSPSCLTREYNHDLFLRLGTDAPLAHIQELWKLSFARLQRNQAQLAPHDFLHSLPLEAVQTRVMSVFVRAQATGPQWELSCPYCPQIFENAALLNKHLVVTHRITRSYQSYSLERDALSGRPQCRHCQFKFFEWRGLRRHITTGSCPLFDPHLAPQVPPADQEIFREHAKAEAWAALLEQPELMQSLREHCVLCGRFFFTGKTLLEHLNLNHFEMWQDSRTHASVIINALRDGKPCQACGKTVVKAHACHVIRQMTIIHLLSSTGRRAEDITPGKPVAPMPPKPADTWQLPVQGQRVREHASTAKSFKHFGRKRHIETGCCKAFNPHRPLGSHVPQTWSELMQLAKAPETGTILAKSEFVQALRTACVLCGRYCSKPGAIHQHQLQDHAAMVQDAKTLSEALQNQATAAGRPCHCGNQTFRKGHQCVVFSQTALLHAVANQEPTMHDAAPPRHVAADAPKSLPLSQVSRTIDSDGYWADTALRSSLKLTCSICQKHLPLDEAEQHPWTNHVTLGPRALELYPDCVLIAADTA